MKTPVLLLVASCWIACAEPPPSRAEVAGTLRLYLLDRHGSPAGITPYAERLEKERGFSKDETADVLLDIAKTESYSLFGRCNALNNFILLVGEKRLADLEPFYTNANYRVRVAAQHPVLYRLSSVPERLAYTKSRFDWMLKRPEFQKDTIIFSGYFSGFLHYSSPSEPERRCIVDFFRTAATNAPYFESAYNADMLLARHDPAWPTNAARRAMIEKWIGDPGVNEKTKTFWTEALAAFSGPQPAPAAPPGGEFPDVPRDPAAADERPVPVERNPNP